MYPNANKENVSTSDVQGNSLRVKGSRAKKALGGVSISPAKPSFKQQVLKDVFIETHRRILADETKIFSLAASCKLFISNGVRESCGTCE